MKKYMTMPDVKIVRFDSKDIIVTSPGLNDGNDNIVDPSNQLIQERRSIWD